MDLENSITIQVDKITVESGKHANNANGELCRMQTGKGGICEK